ncbi:MAG: PfkB family carbohydrate kinase, partial [Thermomicrobiales bacterium]
MRQPKASVICLGECLIDLIADPGHDLSHAGSLSIREGGAPMNVAVGLARLGVPAAICSVVGRDSFGYRLLKLLSDEQVDTTGIRQTTDADTTIAYAWRDDRGDGCFRIVRMADRLLELHDVDRLGIARASAIVVGSVALSAHPSRSAIAHAVELAIAQCVPIIFDVNVRPTLWHDLGELRDACEPILHQARVVKLSVDDAAALWGSNAIEDIQRSLAGTSASVVIVTDGARATWVR